MAVFNAGKATKPQYLILGSMPEEADPQTHIAAGEWCFLNREDIFPDWETTFEMAPNYQPDPEEDLREVKKAMGWAFALLHQYAGEKNHHLSRPLSSYTWEFAYGKWTATACGLFAKAWHITNILVKEYGNIPLTVPVIDGSRRNWSTLSDMFFDLCSAEGMHWILSCILKQMHQCTNLPWNFIHVIKINEKQQSYHDALNKNFSFLQHLRIWILCKMKIIQNQGMGIKGIIENQFAKYIEKILPIQCIQCTSLKQKLRISITLALSRSGKQQYTLLKDNFPGKVTDYPEWCADIFWSLLSEDIRHIEVEITNLRPIIKKRIVSSGYRESRKLLAYYSSLVFSGCNIITTQHAPLYCIMPKIGFSLSEELRYSGFAFWGMYRIDSVNSICIPPFHKQSYYDSHHETLPCIYYVQDMQRPLNSVNTFSLWKDCRTYRQDIKNFVKTIDASLRQYIYFRPYIGGMCSFDSVQWTKKNFPDNNINIESNIEMIAGCRIFVTEYIASSAGESLMCNTPTIIILNENIKRYLDDKQKRILHILFSVKILHYNQEDACRHIYAVWNNVKSWWMDKETQDARNEYLYYDAFTPTMDSFRNCLKQIHSI